jgi:Rrp15p
MVGLVNKKRKAGDRDRERAPRPKKKFKKQTDYHSSDSDASEDEGFAPVNLNDSDDEGLKNLASGEPIGAPTGANAGALGDGGTSDEDGSTNEDSSRDSEDNGQDVVAKRLKKTSKRNDPEAFSTSISKILSTKLSQSARKDPVLSRSREAMETSKELADERLEKKARAKIRTDRKEDLERGRVKDVLGLSSGLAGDTAEEEKKLRKIAQRGVIKLFNAVRAAQVKGEEAAREARKQGTVGAANREERANEMSKQGFLDLINGKNKKVIEEA